MGSPLKDDRKPAYQRRSKRVKVKIPVFVRVQNAEKHTITEKSDALVVSAHGGLILMATPVAKDQFIMVGNSNTGDELLSRVTAVGPTIMGKTEIGIEFIKPAPGFWGLPAPPDDWKPKNAVVRAQKHKPDPANTNSDSVLHKS